MAFELRDYLTLAEDLAKRADDAAKRSAISRAYYAAYGVAREYYVGENGPLPLSASSHSTVCNWFHGSRNVVMKFIGRDGGRLCKLRNLADYEVIYVALDLDLPVVLTLARKTIDNLDSL